MRWPRFGLRAKILLTHLLVVSTSAVALLVVVVPMLWIWRPLPGIDLLLVAIGVVVVSMVAGMLASVLAGGRLVEEISRRVSDASALARRLARGHYAERMPRAKDEGLPPDGKDELDNLALALDELAEALEEAEGRRTQLFGEIIHELRTPIAILEGYFEGLLDGH